MKFSWQRAEAYMGVQSIGKEDFQQTVEKGGILFIDWWAPWCGPCRAFAPVYEKVAEANPDVAFAKINTDEEQELAASFNIRSIPTLMIFRDKVLLFAQPGALSQNVLEELVRKVRELDMEQLRAGIAKQQASPPEPAA
jgi:thioredoxin 1